MAERDSDRLSGEEDTQRNSRVGKAGRAGRRGGGWGGGEEHTVVTKGEVPPKLTSGGRHHPAHLFGLSVLRLGGGGRTEWRRRKGRREGAIFLESFVWGCSYVQSVCARVRVSGVQEEGVQALCVSPVPLCLREGDKYSSRSYNQGRENEEISTG